MNVCGSNILYGTNHCVDICLAFLARGRMLTSARYGVTLINLILNFMKFTVNFMKFEFELSEVNCKLCKVTVHADGKKRSLALAIARALL